ncbi:hypothetical protein ASC75_08455 [Aminobacter sp. DSM 101952]|uniref:hypothetical protein n=1 Tax=Aminobacter sp. DSM 101952 TaxID=2735891 RepID=UPI0006F7D1C7|nr:hypothetical protein [Aminobacter sp. DSM 101952]KQU66658.1 hypothetical protein ASC75_08455 [Aminobacter sp. DSM 101952]
MHDAVSLLCEKLDEVAAKLLALGSSDSRFSQSHGWNHPAISPAQLAEFPSRIATTLRQANIVAVSEADAKALNDASSALAGLLSDVLPSFAGNPSAGLPPVLSTLSYVSITVEPLLGWSASDPKRLPSPLARRLAAIDRQINEIVPDKEELQQKIATLLEAEEAATSLPTTLQELKAANNHMRQISSNASALFGKIEEDQKKAIDYLAKLHSAAEEGAQLVAQAGEAHRITTSIGLAAAFDDRAGKLNRSLGWWVAGLAIALGAAMVVGFVRLSAMKEVLAAETLDPLRIWVQVLLTALSLGAPIWFAWIATKQINQRFRLAEDYAFKASVAKAYEGYRREAVRIDHELEKRLFASALTRLDEAPLRLVEMHTHGSPIHELANSKAVKSVIDSAAALPGRLRGRVERTPGERGAAE